MPARGGIPRRRGQTHHGTPLLLAGERGRIFAAEEIEGMDGVIEDIAAVGVDHVDRHLAAAVVHLIAHGSVAVNLGIAQHEVITFPLDGIAPARDVFVRAHLERHPVGTQCPEAVTNPGKYPGGTIGGRRQRAGPLRRTGRQRPKPRNRKRNRKRNP